MMAAKMLVTLVLVVCLAGTGIASVDKADASSGGDESILFSEFGRINNQSLLWGPYRPNLYFGVRARVPKSVMMGLMWAKVDDYMSVQQSKHLACLCRLVVLLILPILHSGRCCPATDNCVICRQTAVIPADRQPCSLPTGTAVFLAYADSCVLCLHRQHVPCLRRHCSLPTQTTVCPVYSVCFSASTCRDCPNHGLPSRLPSPGEPKTGRQTEPGIVYVLTVANDARLSLHM